jgi:hypothetical protein
MILELALSPAFEILCELRCALPLRTSELLRVIQQGEPKDFPMDALRLAMEL